VQAEEVLQWWRTLEPWEREVLEEVYRGDRVQAYEATRRFHHYLEERAREEIRSLEALLEECSC